MENVTFCASSAGVDHLQTTGTRGFDVRSLKGGGVLSVTSNFFVVSPFLASYIKEFWDPTPTAGMGLMKTWL